MERIIAVNSNCYHKYSIEDAIEGIRDAGFRYIELAATKGWTEHVFPTMSFRYLCGVMECLRDSGVTPLALGGHTNLMDSERIGDFIDSVRLSAFFGCDYIVSPIGEVHIEDRATVPNEEAASHVRDLLPVLDDHGLILVLENHGDYGTGKRLRGIVDIVDSPMVRINYDTANAIFYGNVDLAQDIDSCVDRIGFMHIKDKAGERREWNFPALGRGEVDFPMIFGKLEEAGNDCPLSVEIEFGLEGSRDLAEVNEAVRDSYEYLEKRGINNI
jgi:sugar phosphate isomerase/epimerase